MPLLIAQDFGHNGQSPDKISCASQERHYFHQTMPACQRPGYDAVRTCIVHFLSGQPVQVPSDRVRNTFT